MLAVYSITVTIFCFLVIHKVLGIPSSELSDKMSKAEKERIEEQRKRLGSKGMKERAEILKKSIEANEVCLIYILSV